MITEQEIKEILRDWFFGRTYIATDWDVKNLAHELYTKLNPPRSIGEEVAKAINCKDECIHYESCKPFVNPIICSRKVTQPMPERTREQWEKELKEGSTNMDYNIWKHSFMLTGNTPTVTLNLNPMPDKVREAVCMLRDNPNWQKLSIAEQADSILSILREHGMVWLGEKQSVERDDDIVPGSAGYRVSDFNTSKLGNISSEKMD